MLTSIKSGVARDRHSVPGLSVSISWRWRIFVGSLVLGADVAGANIGHKLGLVVARWLRWLLGRSALLCFYAQNEMPIEKRIK